MKVVRYEGGLFYAVTQHFVASVIEAAGFDPQPTVFAKNKLEAVIKEADQLLNTEGLECGEEDNLQSQHQEGKIL